MSPKPVRATTRKVASATPHAQLLAGILDAAHLYACSAPQLAGMLGRHVLEVRHYCPWRYHFCSQWKLLLLH